MSKRRTREAGNIFFMLFASIAVVGAMTAGAGNIVKGIVTSMSDVTRKTITEEKMQGGARISIQASAGCDIDTPADFMEPTPWRDAAGKPHPAGGGLLPEDIGATLKDPWGTEYGYCAWNFGNGTCPGANLIPGPSDPTKTVVAVISAGKDRKFSTTCNGGNTGPAIPADCTGKGAAHYNDSGTGHCYYLETSNQVWSAARSSCASNGAYLATITNSDEYDAIRNNLPTVGPWVWIGSSDQAVTGEWRWTDGPETGTQFWQGDGSGSIVGGQWIPPWGTNEPNQPGVEHCGLMFPGFDEMGNHECTQTLPSLCEISPAAAPSATMDCSGLGSSHYNDPATGHCYFVSGYTLHGDQANDSCAAEDAHLATITSPAEQAAIANLTMSAYSWIAASDVAVDGNWIWSHGPETNMQFWAGGVGGAVVGGNYANWMTGEPNGGAGENFAALNFSGYGAGKWVDEAVWNNYRSICEKTPPDSSSGVSKTAGSDDIVMEYTYNDANGMSGNDLWKINDTKPGSAKIDKNIDVAGGADFSGPLNLMKSGLILPGDADTGACDDTTDQQIRINFSANPPTLEICNYDGGAGDWTTVSMGGSGGGWEPPSGIVSWWKMDETSGSIVDDFVGSNDGSWQPSGAVVSVPGNNGTALDMNATNSVSVPNNASLQLSTYTIATWLNPDTTPATLTTTKVLDKGENYTINWDHQWGGPLSCELRQTNNTWMRTPPVGSPAAATWMHLACSYDGTTLKLYIDGALASSVAATPPIVSTSSLRLGGAAGGAPSLFPGAMDDVMIFNRALTPVEIEDIYTGTGGTGGGRPPIPSGYVGYWKFDEGAGANAIDSSTNNITGTIVGATWAAGKNGGALDFDGVDDNVDLGTPALLNLDEEATVGAWVNLRTWGAFASFFFYNWSDITYEGIFFGGLGELFLMHDFDQLTGQMALGDWHYVTATVNSAASKLYVDGWLVAEGIGGLTASASPNDTFIGGVDTPGLTAASDGLLDDVIVYGHAMDEAEVQQLFQSMGGVMKDPPALTQNFLLDPAAGQCTSAGQGPFLEVGKSDSAESYDRVFNGKNYLFAGGNDSGISAFTRNGNGTVTRITTFDFPAGNNTYNVYSDDDQTIFAANGTHGVTALTFNGTAFSVAATISTGDPALDVKTYGKHVLAATSTSLIAYTYTGTAFNQVAQYTSPSSEAESFWTDGKYIYLSAGNDGLRVLTFNGTAFEEVTIVPTGGGEAMSSTGDGRYIYVNNLVSLDVYEFNGVTMLRRATYDVLSAGVGQFASLYTDGQNIFLGGGGGSFALLQALRFDGEILKVVGTQLIDDNIVWGNITSDGGYLYLGRYGAPMRIYSGFSCNTGNNNYAGFPTPGFNANYGKISTAKQHSCAIKPDGSAWCWGRADNGRLGNGTTTPVQPAPSKVLTTKAFTQIVAGDASTCALDVDGNAWCWGSDLQGELGNGGISGDQTVPSRVVGNHKFTALTGGYHAVCGLKVNGDLYCWGDNSYGNLGDGSSTNRPSPTLVAGNHKWVYATTNAYVSCGIDTSGQMWCWGSNYVGNLGIGVDDSYGTDYNTPQLVADPGPWLRVDTGSANCGIKYDGTLWCWGQNEMGTVGLGLRDGTTYTNKPKRVADRGPWKEVAADNISCGIKQDGSAWCWGVDSHGELGNNAVTDSATSPFPVADPGPWASITAGNTNCGMKTDGTFWCWGDDNNGAVGNGFGPTLEYPVPQIVSNMPGNSIWNYDETALSIAATGNATNIAMGNTSSIGYKAAGPIHDCTGKGDGNPPYLTDPATGHCYYYAATTQFGTTASAECAKDGGYLVSINSQREQNLVASTFTLPAWIDGSDIDAEGSWLYTGGELAGNKFWNGNQTGNPQNGLYSNWASGEPSDSAANKDCAYKPGGSGASWIAANCASAQIVICEVGTAGPRGGLSFPSAQDTLLSNYDSSTELALETKAASTSAQFSWKAASAANTRSMGVDYQTTAFEIGNNTALVDSWLHSITPQIFINVDGRVGVGVASGTLYNKLTLGGGLRVGNDTSNCHAMRAGTLRYVGGAKPYKYCNGAAWVDF